MADFTTLDGIIKELVIGRAQSTAKAHIRDFGQVRPTCFVLSTWDPMTKTKQPINSVCVDGGTIPPEQLRGSIRRVAMKMHAVGVVYFRQEDGNLKVSLEHREHGDLEWQVKVTKRVIDQLGEAVEASAPTRFLPERHLN